MSSLPALDVKPTTSHVEDSDAAAFVDGKDANGNEFIRALGDEVRIEMTDKQSRLVCRKIDKVILAMLAWIYFLQILDKSTIGYAAVFGLSTDAHLVGNQYSLVSSCGSWAQMAWQPFSALAILKIPTRILLPSTIFLWGLSMVGMAFSRNYSSLMATRFLLGIFEASCLPIFSLVTAAWWRRSEQPVRVAVWYGTNGLSSMIGSALAYGLGKVPTTVLKSYQIIFLFVGLVTVVTSPFIYWKFDNSPGEARFLTPEERGWAVERLRDNNTAQGSTKFDWAQARECFLSPKTWLFVIIAFCLNAGAAVTNSFGPLIIKSFGFPSDVTILLNIPFGFLQLLVILGGSWAATRAKLKSPVLMIALVPCCVGTGMLYGLGRGVAYVRPLLAAYYMLAFLYAGNPIIISWIQANTGGSTKKSLTITMYQLGASSGNLVGPLLFTTQSAPYYHHGLLSTLGLFCAGLGATAVQVGYLYFLNRMKERERVKNGKPAKIHDRSMQREYVSAMKDEKQHVENATGDVEGDVDEETERKRIAGLGANGLKDLSDAKNDEFVYVY